MLLSILIPTYNRSNELIKNLNQLFQFITAIQGWKDIEIVCGDNHSSEEHRKRIVDFSKKNAGLFKLILHPENLGFEGNLLFLLKHTDSDFVMLLGDDDYITCDYLKLVCSYLRSNQYGAIFPNCFGVNEKGERIVDNRDAISEDRILKSYQDIRFIVKAHQLSGLVFRRERTYDAYVKNAKSNMYPQIYFMGYHLLREDGIHITRYPVTNTVLEKKNFNYCWDHLFGEIAKSVDALTLEEGDKEALIRYVIQYNFERVYNRYSVLHPHVFLKTVLLGYDISPLFKKQLVIGFIRCYPIFIRQFLGKLARKWGIHG